MKKIEEIKNKKLKGERIVMLTAYDYPFACFLDEVGVDIILVGDSLANVLLGLSSTREVGMKEMLHHVRAVVRGAQNTMVVADMPFEAYQNGPQQAVENARQFLNEGCHAIKMEWFEGCLDVFSAVIKAGIPLMGHVGLTPQSVLEQKGMKVQGKDLESGRLIIKNAKVLEDIGCFSVLLECVPMELAKIITARLKVPTIGVGAGVYCDGQVLVVHDILGLFKGRSPKFSKKYIDLLPLIKQAVEQYKKEVLAGEFPDDAHSFHMPSDEVKKLGSLKF
ncbi:MAG: 3-methyl-2-oxobutanoate hydroxymethyltransferase [Candidatus Omnitrophica bacterium]|nr:3-methyl-2-oxobutanoate hydroxymethyltransferase [Candidatus Omnitrophota bacterium]